MTGKINSIQTLGTVDGPGVRFVLFMQGCPLRCACCHNPDTWDFAGGEERSAEEIFEMVKRYREYFGRNGGITVSGGEPLIQADFVRELFSLCKSVGIHTALDTSGCIWNEKTERLLEVTDLCLLDIKMTENEQYQRLVGCSMEAPMLFLQKLQEREVDTWIRHVVIGGINANADSMRRLYGIADRYSCVKNVELLKFRKLCMPKYENLGIPFSLADTPETTDAQINELLSAIGRKNK